MPYNRPPRYTLPAASSGKVQPGCSFLFKGRVQVRKTRPGIRPYKAGAMEEVVSRSSFAFRQLSYDQGRRDRALVVRISVNGTGNKVSELYSLSTTGTSLNQS
jgi:hypothetical protein